MSPLRRHDRIDALAREIRELRIKAVDLERAANELDGDGLAGVVAFETRARLEALLDTYFDLVEAARGDSCPIHALDPITACIDCVRAARQRALRDASSF